MTKFILYNFLRQTMQTSIQNLESVAQKMAELSLDAQENPPPSQFYCFHIYKLSYPLTPLRPLLLTPLTKKYHNLLRQFIGSSMQNLESVAQKNG